MTNILRGKPVSELIKSESIDIINKLEEEALTSSLSIVRLGANPDDISYEKSIIRYCQSLNIKTKLVEIDEKSTTEQLEDIIIKLNKDSSVDGILIFRPLPPHIDEDRIARAIDLDKDVDCMNPLNLLKVFRGDTSSYVPCTAKGVMEVCKFYKIELKGKNVCIVNRSEVVGKPLTMMMLEEDATVTICHSKTENLRDITKNSDLIVTALGRAKVFSKDYFKEDSILIDVGMSIDDQGKLSGDIDYEEVKDFVAAITPVPGGVGGITTSILINQMLNKKISSL